MEELRRPAEADHSSTALAVAAFLSCTFIFGLPPCTAQDGIPPAALSKAIGPLVNGEETEVVLLGGVYFTRGGDKYVKIGAPVDAVLASGASVKLDSSLNGLDVKIVDISVRPTELMAVLGDSAAALVEGLGIRCHLRIRALSSCPPGDKQVSVTLPNMPLLESLTQSTGKRTRFYLDQSSLKSSLPVRLAEDLTITFRTFSTRQELKKELDTRSDLVAGIAGGLLSLALLYYLAVTRTPSAGSLLLRIAALFLLTHVGLGSVSKVYAVATGYASATTVYEAVSEVTRILCFLCLIPPYVFLWHYRCDAVIWRTAMADNSVGSYRHYLQTLRWVSFLKRYRTEARRRLEGLLQSAADRWKHPATAGDRYNIIKELIEYIIAQQLYMHPFTVSIGYSSKYVSRFNLLKVLHPTYRLTSAQEAFQEGENKRRQEEITRRIQEAFHKVVPSGVLEFTDEDPGGPSADLRVDYTIETSGNLYFPVVQKERPEAERDYYEGVSAKWNCRFAAGSSQYSFSLTSEPENLLTVILQSGQVLPPPSGVYKAMASSAFAEFEKALTHHFMLPA